MDDYRKKFLVELIRYSQLEDNKISLDNEFGAAIYSTWLLTNPLELNKRNEIIHDAKNADEISFTAHSHTNEPLEASPDDLLIYDMLKHRSKDVVHFIVDGFDCKKIE